jgi:hypothetical protein
MGLGWTHKQKFKMKSTCTTKKRGRLVQIECKWCNEFNKNNLKHKLCTTHTLEGGTTPLLIVNFVTLRKGYIQMTFFPKTPKIGTFVVLTFWTFIYSLNQVFLEHAKALFNSLQKIFSMMYCTSQSEII